MKNISIDLETYSSVDLVHCGVYRYAEAPDFEILLFGYSVDGGEVNVIDLASGEQIPGEVLSALTDSTVTKWGYNSSFERVSLSRYLSDLGMSLDPDADQHPLSEERARFLNPESWRCSMVWAGYLGLPMSLAGTGAALGLDKQKMSEGKELIRYFCMPCAPSKANGGRTRNLPEHDPQRWETFKAYNKRDVETEMAIQQRLRNFPVPEDVWEQYHQDQEINDRGIAVDMTLVENAIRMDTLSRNELTAAIQRLTALENPNSVQQMKTWLADNGIETDTLGKKAVSELLQDCPPELREVLLLRQQLARSSVKKYFAMENCVCRDGRCRGMFRFYGANRTGRFSGSLIQLQNLYRNSMPDLDAARRLVKAGDYDLLRMLYDDVPDTLSQLIRTAFIPAEGCKFIVADFSAIEARVIAWLAGEEWRMELFRKGGDIYCQSASQMFKVPVEKHGINGHLRQKGKIAELACIAEGQLVLTNHGLVPIQHVTTDMKLWDGFSWVQHEGVVFRGVREVITYEGLTATPDHLVWVEGKPEPVQLGLAAACGAHLVQTGKGRHPLRLGGANRVRGTLKRPMELARIQRADRLYDIRNTGPYHRFTVSGKLVHNCGYGGSVGALKAMGALEMGLKEEELKPLVDAWRTANPNIVQLWWDVDDAAMTAVREKTSVKTHGLVFTARAGMLFITLPSGRQLAYVKPQIGENQFGSPAVTYMGIDTTKKWERLETYGPKMVENAVQAIARDILCYAMQTLRCCRIVAHVHDELIIEADPRMSLKAVCEQMSRTPPWAPGLLLRADGDEMPYYMKS